MDEDRWQNVEIRILFPVPGDDYTPHDDERFDVLADLVYSLYEDPVMSSRLVWSDDD